MQLKAKGCSLVTSMFFGPWPQWSFRASLTCAMSCSRSFWSWGGRTTLVKFCFFLVGWVVRLSSDSAVLTRPPFLAETRFGRRSCSQETAGCLYHLALGLLLVCSCRTWGVEVVVLCRAACQFRSGPLSLSLSLPCPLLPLLWFSFPSLCGDSGV